MEFMIFMTVFIGLDILALRYGVDSRDGLGRDPRLVESRVRRSI